MFVETYYDERSACVASSGKPAIPYPELMGEELDLWQRYLPVRTKLEDVPFWFQDNLPRVVMEPLEEARKVPSLFERIEIWSRTGDPMAVGVTGGEHTRYYSIVRWGDAKLTLQQVKRRLRVEEWVFSVVPVGLFVIALVAVLASAAQSTQFPGWAQTALLHGQLLGY